MRKIVCAAILAFAAPACVHAQVDTVHEAAGRSVARDPNLLTSEDFQAADGESLYAVLRRLRPGWLRWDARFGPPDVYVDSVPRGMPSVLHNIPAALVQWVQFSDDREARIRFGRRHPYGLIYVSTTSSPAAASPPVPEAVPFGGGTGLSMGVNGVLPLGRDHSFAGRSRGPGVDVAVVVPWHGSTSWLARLSWSSVEWDSPRLTLDPATPAYDGGLWSATIGLKRHMGESLRAAPYFEASAGAFRAVRDGDADVGIGTLGGPGLDLRLGGRLAAFSNASLVLIRFPGAGTASFWRAQLGLTTFLGPRADPQGH